MLPYHYVPRESKSLKQGLQSTALVLLVFGGLLVLGWLLAPILPPFIAGSVLAYIFYPLTQGLIRHGIPKGLAVLLVLGFAALLVIALLGLLLPLLYQQLSGLAERLPTLAQWLEHSLSPKLSRWFHADISLSLSYMQQFAAEHLSALQPMAGLVLPSLKTGTLATLGALLSLALLPLVMFYMLRDGRNLLSQCAKLLPRPVYPGVSAMMREINHVLGEYLRGQLSVMLVMALYYVIVLKFLGLEFAFSAGLISGLLVFIPYMGMAIGLFLATSAALLQFETWTPVFMVWLMYGVGQALEGFIVTPWLIGERIGLHPLLVLFVLMSFGQLFGFFGVLMALPMAACLLIFSRLLKQRYLRSRFYQRPTRL